MSFQKRMKAQKISRININSPELQLRGVGFCQEGGTMTKVTYNHLVDYLTELRKKHHISVSAMAKYTGVSRQSIHNFESHNCNSYRLILSYINHPAFNMEELEQAYKILGG